MIQAVSDTCSVRWTKVNHKVYKFQSLVFSEDKNHIEEAKPSNTFSLTSVNNTQNSEKKQIKQVKQIINQQEETTCPSQFKITGPIQWKEVYGEYLGKEPDFPEMILGSPNESRTSAETPAKIARKSSESPLLRRGHKDMQDLQINKEIIVKKDQRRVHFEDEVRLVKCDDEDDVFEQPKKNCLKDCSLCRSIPSRDFSPPYQALVEKSRHRDPNHEEKVD